MGRRGIIKRNLLKKITKGGFSVIDVGKSSFYQHRENGLPAEQDRGIVIFFIEDKLHRPNGPSWNSGNYTSWDLFDNEINAVQYFKFLDYNGIDINNITDADKLLIALEYNVEKSN